MKDGNANGLCIRITGSDLSGGRDGNVSFDDFVKANGRVVLDLAGSFAGTDDDLYEAEEPESSTEISVGYGEAEPGSTEEEAA